MQGGFFMEKFQVYRDIQARTGGDIYIGVVGPVRTGKSTFIRRFMELVALPEMEPEKQAEVRDQLPLSGSGKLITTVEPKFIPKEAIEVPLGEEQKVRIRLIDCVGFLVKDASGHIEEGKERMVKTPWFEKAIPFHEAAETGTRKVIEEHATIGLVITTDGSFGELPRENFVEAEAATISQLKKQRKPFLLLVNSQAPYKEETQELVHSLEKKYGVITMAANCEQLRKEDVTKILSNVLYEFPVTEIQFFVPKWVEMLPSDHELKAQILDCIRTKMKEFHHIKDITRESVTLGIPCVQETMLEEVSLSSGCVRNHGCLYFTHVGCTPSCCVFLFYCSVSGIFVQGWMKEFAGRGYISSQKKGRRSGDTLRFLCPPVRLWMSNFVNSLTLKQNKITHRWHSRSLGSLAESPDHLPFFL
jgi:stage IV sporulation protein A